MTKLPRQVRQKLKQREQANTLRELSLQEDLIDFSSNDYLGFAQSKKLYFTTHTYLVENHLINNGSTGSRLLSGHSKLHEDVENYLKQYHNVEAALLFNSGYTANLGLFATIPQRGDVVLYDEYIHASIRDGLQMSKAKSYKFNHNSTTDLAAKIQKHKTETNEVFVSIEAVYSMDGDAPDLQQIISLCETTNTHLIIDEAHYFGVEPLNTYHIYQKQADKVFARLVTYGKAMGCHGAAILGSQQLKDYLVNFSRSFIYTTALSNHSLATIYNAYKALNHQPDQLKANIHYFKQEVRRLHLDNLFIESDSAIHCCLINDIQKTKTIAKQLRDYGYSVLPILSPTVPKDQERLRFCLHTYNSQEQITSVLTHLANYCKENELI